jgi:SdrD B-like domain
MLSLCDGDFVLFPFFDVRSVTFAGVFALMIQGRGDMKTAVRIISSVLCVLSIVAANANGMCTMQGPVCAVYVNTPVVFFGRAVSRTLGEEIIPVTKDGKTEYLPDQYEKVRFAVIDGFKGVAGADAELRMALNCGGECYFPFEVGSTYLVFAEIRKDNGSFTTSGCSLTRLVTSDDDPDLVFLRSLKTAPPTAKILGGVYLPRDASSRQSKFPNGIANVAVTLEGPAGAQATRTDARGQFEFAGIAAGDYTVSAEIPAGLVVQYPPRKMHVVERSCAEANFFTARETTKDPRNNFWP